ncbi:MAG: hypothetical protein LBS73_03825, partial [Campylobacteraceae bacterium]|nr:hypothetical protein [Campylobacteraceae bacterium]
NSNLNTEDVIASRDTVLEFDFERMYQKRIKNIYGKILNFVILAQSNIANEEMIRDLNDMQKAALGIVEALKDVKHMQKNLTKYMLSDNGDIKSAYNHIREDILAQIRVLNSVFEGSDKEDAVALIGQVESLGERFDTNAGRSLGSLIKAAKISPLLGTSLMNDNAYAHNISKSLISAAKTVLIHQDDVSTEEMKTALMENKTERTKTA